MFSMCLAFVVRTEDRIIAIFNRDEDYDREATSMDYDGDLDLYYGKDISRGGSWFVTNSFGDFSFVTNIRKKINSNANKKSRGELPFKSMKGEDFHLDEYGPCNLVTFKQGKLYYQNSMGEKEVIEGDYFGISNGTHPNNWPKVKEGIKKLRKLDFSQNTFDLIVNIRNIMQNKVQYNNLPTDTGFTEEEEKVLSSAFIDTGDYGTVSTTVLIIEKYSVNLNEKNYANFTEFNRIL